MTTTEPTPEAVEALADVFAPHVPRIGTSDTEFWLYCTCDPDHVFTPRPGSAASSMDAQWVRDADEAHREHVARAVLAAGYVSPERHARTAAVAQRDEAEKGRLWQHLRDRCAEAEAKTARQRRILSAAEKAATTPGATAYDVKAAMAAAWERS